MKNCALVLIGVGIVAGACSGSDDNGAGSSSSSSGATSTTSSTGGASSSGQPDASTTSSSSGTSGDGATHPTPTGFDPLKVAGGGPGGGSLTVDGANRLWGFESINTVYYADDNATEVKTDPLPLPAGKGCKAGTLTTGPDGSVYAACQPGLHVLKHPAGDGSWSEVSTGLAGSEFTTYIGGVGFDAAGNAFTLTGDINSSNFQLYKLPAGTTTWASTGPVLKGSDGADLPPRRLAVDSDGTIYAIAGKLFKLAPGGAAYEKALPDDTDDIVRAKDGTIYVQTGVGNGLKVVSKPAGTGTFTPVTTMAAGGSAGVCQTGTGEVYAGTTNAGVLWKLAAGAFSVVTFDQAGFTSDQVGLACAPNGHVWLVGSDGLHRSKP